jgi:hypothetical protein
MRSSAESSSVVVRPPKQARRRNARQERAQATLPGHKARLVSRPPPLNLKRFQALMEMDGVAFAPTSRGGTLAEGVSWQSAVLSDRPIPARFPAGGRIPRIAWTSDRVTEEWLKNG